MMTVNDSWLAFTSGEDIKETGMENAYDQSDCLFSIVNDHFYLSF